MIKKHRYRVRKHGLKMLMILLALFSLPAQGHLLNMTKVQVQINDAGEIKAEVKLDLAKEFSGDENYFNISQAKDALADPQVQSMLADLTAAFLLSLDQQPLSWRIDSVSLPDEAKQVFLSDIAWPMTTVTLSATLAHSDSPSAKMKAVFADSFAFEEPIALTIQQMATGRKMSRWLVTNQVSPGFVLNKTISSELDNNEVAWQWDIVKDYVWLGIKHIVPMGWDHVLFVLGLFLGIRSIANLLALITTFTLAHSLTLALSAYGAIQAPASIVEPLIAISIMWVAVENSLFKQPPRWRFVIVFMFGLLHGLGFAAALRQLDLPTNSFLASLISFNVGIELAQIALVVSAYLLVGWLRKTVYWRTWVVIPASTVIAGIAFYWSLSRIII